jgi:2-deoxy-D-gluconate 3-dehydrogenase
VTRLFDLSGRLAVVTGARRGIGRAMAEALAEAGADIIGVSASMEAEGSDLERRVRACGREFTGLPADFANPEDVRRLAQLLNDLARPVDVLVNNAGTIARAPAAEHTDEDWGRVLQVDLTSQFVLTREIGRSMIARGSGKVIFTASMLSFQGGINVPGYTAAKSGLVGLTKALSNEWASKGVNVNAIAPDISPPTTPRRCTTTPTGTARSWNASRPVAGVSHPISRGDRVPGVRRLRLRQRHRLPVDGDGSVGERLTRPRPPGRPGVIPVVVIDDPSRAAALGSALLLGGLPCAEVTLRTDTALESLRALAENPDLLVGAGTVLRPAQVEAALQAGARYIVSPASRVGGQWCQRSGVPCFPVSRPPPRSRQHSKLASRL